LDVGIAMQTDQDLLARLGEADPSPALAELIRRHGRMVERTVLRLVRDEHLAQDVCQAVFCILLKKAAGLKGPGAIAGWLHRTAILTARNALRVETRRRRHEEAAGGMNERATVPVLPEGFDEALARLPDIYREAVVLRYLEGRSLSEIGRSLDLSDKAVDLRVSRGVERLRKALAVAALTGLLAAEASAAAAAGPLAAVTIGSGAASLAKGAMQTMFWMKMKTLAATACAAALLSGVGLSFLQGQAAAQETDFDKLHRFIKPQPGESRWMEVDWHPSVWEARKKAAAEGKPLLLWAGSGGAPSAGC
jgi:RNA polymerase sigma factor (sigma-70 family)